MPFHSSINSHFVTAELGQSASQTMVIYWLLEYLAVRRASDLERGHFSLRASTETSKHGVTHCPQAKGTNYYFSVCFALSGIGMGQTFCKNMDFDESQVLQQISLNHLSRQAAPKTITVNTDLLNCRNLFSSQTIVAYVDTYVSY